MYRIIDNDVPRCQQWLAAHNAWIGTDMVATIGLEKNGELVAVAGYNLFVAKSCHAHFCILPGERMTKDFLWFAHYFPFVQAGCAVIVALVEIANVRIRRLMKKSGYVDMATIDEGGVMVSVLHKKDCRFLDIRG